jgi:hypothetical protein
VRCGAEASRVTAEAHDKAAGISGVTALSHHRRDLQTRIKASRSPPQIADRSPDILILILLKIKL